MSDGSKYKAKWSGLTGYGDTYDEAIKHLQQKMEDEGWIEKEENDR